MYATYWATTCVQYIYALYGIVLVGPVDTGPSQHRPNSCREAGAPVMGVSMCMTPQRAPALASLLLSCLGSHCFLRKFRKCGSHWFSSLGHVQCLGNHGHWKFSGLKVFHLLWSITVVTSGLQREVALREAAWKLWSFPIIHWIESLSHFPKIPSSLNPLWA